MGRETVSSPDVTVTFDGQRCIHSRHCVLDRPDVFVPNVQGAWIHPERATPGEVLELAHNCPSGAIQCQRPDGTALEQPPVVNTVRVRENGPLAFHAELVVAGQPDGLRATLCRCGASHNKPYCDGSHTAAGFSATGEPATLDSQPLAQRNGPVQVQPTSNGPLHVTGSLEMVSGTGRTITRVTEAWLCRCGQSANKPFCDGSHVKAGFVSGD
ncbi:MAG: CDGSH iron-sulfur domain-containing protein [Comamonas sp.]